MIGDGEFLAMMSNRITYSPAYTLVPTYECFNRCSYCNFRTDPGKSPWLSLEAAEKILRLYLNQGIIEILILSGEVHPQSSRRQDWFNHIYQLCELALSLGFLPHSNIGPLSYEEMKQLKTVNVSMGLMLEQLTPKLLQTVHRHAPSKDPKLRLQQLEWAGELQIPFTTGLLLGIGETVSDWEESLKAIATTHQRWGHIQEVILQPHSLGSQQHWQGDGFNLYCLPEVINIARSLLPENISIQIPPNLIDQPSLLLECLSAGAQDLGGISPKDEVNPDYPHPYPQQLAELLTANGWQLVPRLPIYPQYDHWLSSSLKEQVSDWRLQLSDSQLNIFS
jgi:FO synthase subunit 1